MKKESAEPKQESMPVPKKKARAVVKYLRISPRKVRLVINTVRYQRPDTAFGILMHFKKKAARMVEKIVKTAVANAKVLGMDETRLYISDIRADGGPVLKRFMQRSMGRADRILKRTTHLSVVLSESDRQKTEGSALEEKESLKEKPKAAKASWLRSKKKTAKAGA